MFQPRKLLWESITESAPGAELDEIRRKVGSAIIDQNMDLHEEVKALAEILSDFQQQNDALRDEIQQRPKLPEPPAKAMIERQIVLVLENLKVRSESRQSTLEDELTPVLKTPRDRELLEHVASNYERTSTSPRLLSPRASTPRSGRASIGIGGVRPYSAGRMRPRTSDSDSICSSSSSRPSTALSVRSAPSFSLSDGMQNNLNIYEIEHILDALRDSFKEEKQRLQEDIEFLTMCLEDESEVRAETEIQGRGTSQPSMTDLRNFCGKLEEHWISQDKRDQTEAIMEKLNRSQMSSNAVTNHKLNPKGPLPVIRGESEGQESRQSKPLSRRRKQGLPRTSGGKSNKTHVKPPLAPPCSTSPMATKEYFDKDELPVEEKSTPNPVVASSPRSSRVRSRIQEALDEQFLS